MLPEFLSNEWIVIYGGLTLTLLILFVETAFPIGSIIPGGEILLFVAGLLGGTKWIEVNILFIVIPLTLISFIADLTGYTRGYKIGPRLFEGEGSVFQKKKSLKRAEKFNEKYGVWALVFARFFPVIRTFSPLINGAKEYDFHRFFIFSGLGTIVYVNSMILFGFFIGRKFPDLKDNVEYIIGAVVLYIFVTPILYLIRLNNQKKRIDS